MMDSCMMKLGGWMQPVMHALGALLLEQGHLIEMEAIFRADLGLDSTLVHACQHPDNLCSLHGLVECLEKLGAGDTMETRVLGLDSMLVRACQEPRQPGAYMVLWSAWRSLGQATPWKREYGGSVLIMQWPGPWFACKHPVSVDAETP